MVFKDDTLIEDGFQSNATQGACNFIEPNSGWEQMGGEEVITVGDPEL
jgi:hypothetical protein